VAVAAWAFEGAEGGPFDAIVILAIIVLNAILGYAQEARAEEAVSALQQTAAPTARVPRATSCWLPRATR
jgi:Ca2+-transporting ATPase